MAAKKDAGPDTPSVEETKAQEQAVVEQAAEDRVPTEYYEVRVNPKLVYTDMVSIGGFNVYKDPDLNRTQGTEYMDDIQWESISDSNRDQDTGLQLLLKKKLSGIEEEVS